MSQEEIERRKLQDLPVIADSEISPSAYLFQHQEEHDELNLFESEYHFWVLTCFRSMKVKCPFCDAVSYSIVEYRTSFLGYLVAVFSILIFGFLSIILMPFLISLTKQAIHRCAKCLNEVKSNSYFGFSSLEDKVIIMQNNMFIDHFLWNWKLRYYSYKEISSVHRGDNHCEHGYLSVRTHRSRA